MTAFYGEECPQPIIESKACGLAYPTEDAKDVIVPEGKTVGCYASVSANNISAEKETN